MNKARELSDLFRYVCVVAVSFDVHILVEKLFLKKGYHLPQVKELLLIV